MLVSILRLPKDRMILMYAMLNTGLAISGGVDSMALATLCKGFYPTPRYERINFRPFVVDHKARRGSTEEARGVVSALKMLGFWNAKILTVHWPEGVEPATLPNFESLARRLRYQALGKACRQYGISSLLLAHHEDDQAETVLMRLTNGHRGMGLAGIKPASNIPECWGMHGVHQSGALDKRGHFLGASTESTDTCNRDINGTVLVEGGGVTIHRPLLRFSKDRLIATCLNADTPWFEDHTNENPTLTFRNTIRQLLKPGNLPQALQKPSLLAMSWKKREEEVAMRARIEKRLSASEVKFDIRSGKLIIRLRRDVLRKKPKSEVPEEYKEHLQRYLRNIATFLLRRFLEIVSPLESIPLAELRVAARIIFPEAFENPETRDQPGINPAEAFTIASVSCRKITPENIAVGQRRKESDYQEHGWVLMRQPYRKSEPFPVIAIPPEKRFKESDSASRGSWHLWDGRYWIRVYNHTNKLAIVRPLEPADLKPFRNSLPTWSRQSFNNTLSAAAPDKIRWTLPALATESEVVALPTLGFAVQKEEYRGLRWQIRYKKVDLGKKEPDDPARWWGGRYSPHLKARGINNEV
ncbi:hypothetical protein FGG08_000421 [Glutinoglossum americanum]|uniref:tRNA(Ile)-lysidine synthetase n=1 Tax=Glutinoglossum americanum TaxID=1670608 RepID=A0A9P8ID54_9PEZI|nr:hypothetical protein FGG08_000421 [Glutinoglossum americanum]